MRKVGDGGSRSLEYVSVYRYSSQCNECNPLFVSHYEILFCLDHQNGRK